MYNTANHAALYGRCLWAVLESGGTLNLAFRCGPCPAVAKERSVTLEKFVIRGGTPLSGEVTIGGAKNAAVAILPATILAGGRCIIENLPCISDVMASLQILSELGADIQIGRAHV